jgi:inner membrane protein
MNAAPPVSPNSRFARRQSVTLKLLGIVGLTLVLLIPLHLINALRAERSENRRRALERPEPVGAARSAAPGAVRAGNETAAASAEENHAFEGYRMVERAVKHGALVLALVFAAFFLFEILGGLRLHPFHYCLVGAALSLFYLALLALGEVIEPGPAYVGAAVASSSLIVCYSAAVLRAWARASLIAGLLAIVHSVLYVVLRLEDYALLAGTAALFGALAAVMFFTRNVDWYAQDASPAAGGTGVP